MAFVMLLSCGASAQVEHPLQMFCGGVKAGVSMGDYRLTAPIYYVYHHKMTVNAVAGAWLQFRTKVGFSLRPEVAYAGKGADLEWEDVHYRLRANCIDTRLGLLYNFTIKKTLLSPYIIAAPVWNVVMDGGVEYTDYYTGDIAMQLSRSSMRTHDFGIFCGAGLEYPIYGFGWTIILSGEVGYNWGFSNSFSRREQSGDVTVLNPSLDQLPALDQRLSRGLEVTLRMGVPFGKEIGHVMQHQKKDDLWLDDDEDDDDGFMEDEEDEDDDEEEVKSKRKKKDKNKGEESWETKKNYLKVQSSGEEEPEVESEPTPAPEETEPVNKSEQ